MFRCRSLCTYDSIASTIAACINDEIRNAHVHGVFGLLRSEIILLLSINRNIYLYIFLGALPPTSGGVKPSRE